MLILYTEGVVLGRRGTNANYVRGYYWSLLTLIAQKLRFSLQAGSTQIVSDVNSSLFATVLSLSSSVPRPFTCNKKHPSAFTRHQSMTLKPAQIFCCISIRVDVM